MHVQIQKISPGGKGGGPRDSFVLWVAVPQESHSLFRKFHILNLLNFNFQEGAYRIQLHLENYNEIKDMNFIMIKAFYF